MDRSGADPIKNGGNPFRGTVPGADDPFRIKPDVVHTFHIGFGADLCASMIVWLCLKGKFGANANFDERLYAAFSSFQLFCHTTHRYTACDVWSKKNLGMTSCLGCTYQYFALKVLGPPRVIMYGLKTLGIKQNIPKSLQMFLASKDGQFPNFYCRERT